MPGTGATLLLPDGLCQVQIEEVRHFVPEVEGVFREVDSPEIHQRIPLPGNGEMCWHSTSGSVVRSRDLGFNQTIVDSDRVSEKTAPRAAESVPPTANQCSLPLIYIRSIEPPNRK